MIRPENRCTLSPNHAPSACAISAWMASAIACYNSPEYQANIKVRQPHSIADLIIIEGYDGPQP